MTTAIGDVILRGVPPEPWGRTLQRIREGYGLSLEQAADIVGASRQTINRLEQLATAPDYAKHREVAALICVACQVHPAEIELSRRDLPHGTNLLALQAAAAQAARRYRRGPDPTSAPAPGSPAKAPVKKSRARGANPLSPCSPLFACLAA